jgi:acyl-CoA reductase-like NAD-dependent aldehyde dehydrogenase
MTLELGGKSPQIVFAYADPDFAADAIARLILPKATQACVADSVLIADRRILDDLPARPVPDRRGRTKNAQTAFAPITSVRQLRWITVIVARAVAHSVTVLAGCGDGYGPAWILLGADPLARCGDRLPPRPYSRSLARC